jgi:hypothetical protein
MRFNNDEAIRQIDELLKYIRRNQEKISGNLYDDNADISQEIIIRVETLIERLTPVNSKYNQHIQSIKKGNEYNFEIVNRMIGILKGLKHDYKNNYLQTFEELVNADLFSDILEMAKYLLEENYKDSSAVLIGGVLEEKLRKLCQKNNIAYEKADSKGKIKHIKSSDLNIELKKVCIYNEVVKKQVDAWLDLRNNAAHGKFSEYDKSQVKMMLDGVQKFLDDYLA